MAHNSGDQISSVNIVYNWNDERISGFFEADSDREAMSFKTDQEMERDHSHSFRALRPIRIRRPGSHPHRTRCQCEHFSCCSLAKFIHRVPQPLGLTCTHWIMFDRPAVQLNRKRCSRPTSTAAQVGFA
jgi:hypothetical protein